MQQNGGISLIERNGVFTSKQLLSEAYASLFYLLLLVSWRKPVKSCFIRGEMLNTE